MDSRILAALMLALTMVGCDTQTPQRRSAGGSIAGVGLESSDVAAPQPAPPPPARAIPQPNAAAPTAPPAERVRAEAGVGVKGRTLTGRGYLQTVFRTKFQFEQQAEFLKMQHAMQLFEAEHGRRPESHEEFMEKIIRFNQIQLPRLPEGEKYVYDPATGELMVERPPPGPK